MDKMNVIKVCDGATVWWHVTKGEMQGEFETVADYIPDEQTAYLIATAPALLALAHAMLGFDLSTPKDYATKGADAFSPLARHLISLQNQARTAITEATGKAAA